MPIIAAQFRAHAWKNLGKSYRALGRMNDSLTALDHAEQEIIDFTSATYDLAVVRFNVAVSLQEAGRFEESLRLVAECKDVFIQYADADNVTNCGIAEGVLLQRLHKYREAKDTLQNLLTLSQSTLTASIAAIHHSLGYASIEIDDFDAAREYLEHAITMHRQLNLPIHVLRGEMGLGRLYVREGNSRNGITLLRRVRADLAAHGLFEEAGLCALDIVDAYLRSDRPEKAEPLARTVVEEFTRAGLNSRAITALGYLSEAIQTRKATPASVINTRDYILSLRADPEREFSLN
ncbi:MAG TPA: tetratricopeptide repeat protein [Thermoanaerobaculia bacterium]